MKRRICDICKKPIYDDKLHYRVYLFRAKEYVYEPTHPRKQKKKDICASCWYDVLVLIDGNLLKEENNADSDRKSTL